MKYNMKDLTVLIPVRVDSLVRLENVLMVTRYLCKYFEVNIIVLEADRHNNGILSSLLLQEVNYMFVLDNDPVFYRTKYINQMALKVTTEFLAVWDADVVFPPVQVNEALLKLRSGDYDIYYPYDGDFMDTSKLIRDLYLESGKIELLEELGNMMLAPYGKGMRGGAFLANASAYRVAGMENLNFYGWGPEDWERYERWENLGYRIGYSKGCLFHLSHPRDLNGTHNSCQQKMYTFYEKDTIRFSSKEEIQMRMDMQMKQNNNIEI